MSKSIQIGKQEIKIKETDTGDYLSLTDLAKLVNPDTSRVISKWIEMLRTIDFLDVWEKTYNPDYDSAAYQAIRMKAGVPSFYLSAQKWIKSTNAIGIESKSGKYGGTYAHHLIALEFCSSMSAEFRLKVFHEYLEMKQNDAQRWLKENEFYLRKIEDNSLENNRLAQDLKQNINQLKKGK